MTILTHQQAAAFLQVSQLTLSKTAVRDGIPRRKVGREWRYVQEDLEAYVRGAAPVETSAAVCTLPVEQTGRVLHHRGVYALTGGKR